LAQNLTKSILKRAIYPISSSMSKSNLVREGRERILFAMLIEFSCILAKNDGISEAVLNYLAVKGMGWPAHTGGPGPWVRLKGKPYWEALSANYKSRFGGRFTLPVSWNLWFK
ncbi:hypothetical protein EBX93_10155, partial [bacterium]|nr:hypothetical protein [bacterium]